MHSLTEIKEVYKLPLTSLIYKAQEVHQQYHQPDRILLTAAQSIKTGGCPEDCAFCPQSSHYSSDIKASWLDEAAVLEYAQSSKDRGARRVCLGAAWGNAPQGGVSRIAKLIPKIKELGLEVCCSIGTLNDSQLDEIKSAGCNVVNYNLDTSKNYYEKVIKTRSYDDRFSNLKRVQSKGFHVCCGGILGVGESEQDRLELLESLVSLTPQPESIPVNWFVPVKGTPLGDSSLLFEPLDYVRFIATARIFMPKTFISLAAGRIHMSEEIQLLCFLAGANSFIIGDKILTTSNPSYESDKEMMNKIGLKAL